MKQLPAEFAARMKQLLGEEEYTRYERSFDESAVRAFRVNTEKISVSDFRERSDRIILRREHILVMVSDGITETDALRCCMEGREEEPRELASRLLECCRQEGDDATVAIIRLAPTQDS